MFSALCSRSIYDYFFGRICSSISNFLSFDIFPNSFELEITSDISFKKAVVIFLCTFVAGVHWEPTKQCISFRGKFVNPKFSRSVLLLHFSSSTSFSAALLCNTLKYLMETPILNLFPCALDCVLWLVGGALVGGFFLNRAIE